jgi:carbon storage regulator
MLILSRKPGESIMIDGRIHVKVVRVEGDIVKVGIEAPPEVPVHRMEVYLEIQGNNRRAVVTRKPPLPRVPLAQPARAGNPQAAGVVRPQIVVRPPANRRGTESAVQENRP